MNRHDSELLEGQLRSLGLEPATGGDTADLVLLNTCSVRERPVHKILTRIGSLEKLPRPPVIGVCGCVAEQEGAGLLERSDRVGFVLGPGQIGRLSETIRGLGRGGRPVVTGFGGEREPHFETVFRTSPTRGMVTVIEGCNEFCTFCVVPYTRGREVSRPLEAVLDEVRGLAAGGLKEVELLGQTINAYRCPDSGADFADLLRRVAAVDGLLRVRYITSHPRHFDRRLVEALAELPTVSRELHLPVQSGSNRILKRMHRGYTREQYQRLVARLRRAVPDITLSTDIIVGFPGETEADFEQTLELLEELGFGQVFGFVFSPRPRTPAARYGETVPEQVAKQRLHRLFELTDRIALELNRELVGDTVRVLVDGDSRRDPRDWQGRGEDNRVVNFAKTAGVSVGDVVEVRITRAGAHSLVGVVAGSAPPLPVVDSDRRGVA